MSWLLNEKVTVSGNLVARRDQAAQGAKHHQTHMPVGTVEKMLAETGNQS
jgi:hypothetical protein